MTVTFEGAGVLLSFVIAGVITGTWAMTITLQVRSLRAEVAELRRLIVSMQSRNAA